jgi:hypothetical protein
MDSPHDLAEAFNRLDALLAAAEAAGPSIALLMEAGPPARPWATDVLQVPAGSTPRSRDGR